MATENLTLSEAQLSACKPIHGEGGRAIRAFCPFHGSDKQRSLRVDVATGRFNCFACGAWGYTEEARERWETERKQQSPARHEVQPARRPVPRSRLQKEPAPICPNLLKILLTFQALSGSLGGILRRRGFLRNSRTGMEYAAGTHGPADRGNGEVVFPLTDQRANH